MIKRLQIYAVFSFIATSVLLAAGFYGQGNRANLPAFLGLLCFGFFTRRIQGEWPTMMVLGCLLLLGVAGVLSGVSQWLILPASVFSLITWDLLSLEKDVRGQAESPQLVHLIQAHTKLLIVAAGAGLILILLGGSLRLNFPFTLVNILVLTTFFGLDRVVNWLQSGQK